MPRMTKSTAGGGRKCVVRPIHEGTGALCCFNEMAQDMNNVKSKPVSLK